MKAIAVENYGAIDALVAKEVPDPGEPTGRDILVRVKASSVNPVDTKVRRHVYDDYFDYYDRVPRPYQILGYDGAGVIEAVSPDSKLFSPGDEVFYSGSPIRHGSNAELQLVDERLVAKKPKNLDWCEAAAMPLTYVTAYEALVERLEIKKGEKAGLVIINGAGGVGAVATQIARKFLDLPVVITTASRPETREFSKSMGATHIVNHREDLAKQVAELKLDVPVKYVFITHSTDMYMEPCAKILAPFGKVVSIVQGQAKMYGTEFMAKSLSYIWCLIGTKPYYGVEMEGEHSHRAILEELRQLVEDGTIKTHLKKRLPLTVDGVRKGHELIESGGSIGKVAMGVDVEGTETPFA